MQIPNDKTEIVVDLAYLMRGRPETLHKAGAGVGWGRGGVIKKDR